VRACFAEQALSGLHCPVDRAWLNYGELARSLNFWRQLTSLVLIEMMFDSLQVTVSVSR
jgi:hypothetical protein